MIIHDLNIVGIAVTPREALTPLCVYPYAVLASAIAKRTYHDKYITCYVKRQGLY